jgi:hypothetical protein
MMRRIGLALALCSLAATTAVAGTVYKWADRQGQVHYTDRPPRGDGSKLLAVIQESTGASNEDTADQAPAEEPADGTDAAASVDSDADQQVSAAMKKSVEADVAKTRAEQCKKAKDRYQNYVDSVRVYREKDGKREYLNQKELDQARLRAAQDVETFCGK